MDRSVRFKSANRIIQVGFWINAGLMTMKLLAGHFGGSEAVFADGMESAADLIAMLSSMVALRIGSRPYDQDHPYGHGRAENIAAIIVALVIFATGGWILYRAAHTIITGSFAVPQGIAVTAAFVTIIVKESLYRHTVKTGRRLGSPAILAAATDHRKDAVTSVGTLAGVTGAYFGVVVLDPLAAGLTSLVIFHIGYETFMAASHEIMDGRPEDACVDDICRIAEAVEGVEHVHEIKCRRSGQYLIVDLKLDMPPDMTVKRSHAIATEVKRRIFEQYHNVGDVMIHINPHEEEHEDMIRL